MIYPINSESTETSDFQSSITVPNTLSTYKILAHLSADLINPQNRVRVLVATALSGCHIALNIIAPMLLAETIQLLNSDDEERSFAGIEFNRFGLITTLGAMSMLMELLPNLKNQLLAPVKANTIQSVLKKSMAHVLNRTYDDDLKTPTPLKMQLVHKSLGIGAIGPHVLSNIAPKLTEIIAASTYLSQLYGYEIGVILITLVVASSVFSRLTALRNKVAQTNVDNIDETNRYTIENIINRYQLASRFGCKNKELEKLETVASQWRKEHVHANVLLQELDLGHTTLANIAMFAIALYTGLHVRSGKYSYQDFITLISYMRQLASSLPEFGQALNHFFATYPDLKYLLEQWINYEQIADPFPNVRLSIHEGQLPTIEFKNVTFTYPNNQEQADNSPILNDLSFTINPGEIVAFIGQSGCGKSTIYNLLTRNYTPTSGQILINGTDISKVSLESVQSAIALFGQNPNLFAGTVRENICYAENSLTDETIMVLARAVQVHDIINGLNLDTEVGEFGINLTDAQQSAVSLLRSLLKKGSIRFLDEITSLLDTKSAEPVLNSLIENSKNNSTTIITSRKPIHVPNVKNIILEKGKVIAQGTHEELAKNCNEYTRLTTLKSIHSKLPPQSMFAHNKNAQQTQSDVPNHLFQN